MSKKLGFILLLAAVLLFTGFTAGLLVGKNLNDTEIVLSKSDDPDRTQTDVPVSSQNTVNNGLININTATVAELMELPGIGEVIAQRIVDYRQENGSFASIDDLTNVSGIGEARIRSISKYITVGG